MKNVNKPFSAGIDVDVGVLDPNMENVLDKPVRLLFMKFAVACDDDENNDDAPATEPCAVLDVVTAAVLVVIVVAEKLVKLVKFVMGALLMNDDDVNGVV